LSPAVAVTPIHPKRCDDCNRTRRHRQSIGGKLISADEQHTLDALKVALA
jgi:hypothetical protein